MFDRLNPSGIKNHLGHNITEEVPILRAIGLFKIQFQDKVFILPFHSIQYLCNHNSTIINTTTMDKSSMGLINELRNSHPKSSSQDTCNKLVNAPDKENRAKIIREPGLFILGMGEMKDFKNL